MCASVNFATVVRVWFTEHPDELRDLYKKYKNDLGYLCSELTNTLNQELKQVPIESEEIAKVRIQIKRLREEKDALNPNDNADQIKASEIQTKILKLEQKMSAMPKYEIGDLSFQRERLNQLTKEITNALANVAPTVEPCDIQMRRELKFEKKMELNNALFTILYNTRPQTIPVSVLNLKAWVYRFVKRLNEPETSEVGNLPTALFFRSRQDNGQVKGNCGKSTLGKSCLAMLKRHGLECESGVSSLPTFDRVDKKMSDKSFLYIDDVNMANVDWTTLNKFCDGVFIKNRGKYEREEFIFPFGNILATTNYDLNYTNNTRYPVVEFTPNDVRKVLRNETVKENIIYKSDPMAGLFDYTDAWETLFALAEPSWLTDYLEHKIDVLSTCTRQRTRLQNLLEAFLVENSGTCHDFKGRDVMKWLKENYRDEVRHANITAVCEALNTLGVKHLNKDRNEYQMRFLMPKAEDLTNVVLDDEPKAVWKWISTNGDKEYAKWEEV